MQAFAKGTNSGFLVGKRERESFVFLSRSRSCACCSGVQHKDERREVLLNIPGGDTSRKTSYTDAGKARCSWFARVPNVSGGKRRATENKERLKTERCFYSESLFLASRVKKQSIIGTTGIRRNFLLCNRV